MISGFISRRGEEGAVSKSFCAKIRVANPVGFYSDRTFDKKKPDPDPIFVRKKKQDPTVKLKPDPDTLGKQPGYESF